MVSVIIPVFNEEDQIKDQIDLLLNLPCLLELIIVDGGSADETITIIEGLKDKRLRLLTSEKGRALQMNVGADSANGENILFLHIDTRLPPNGLELIEKELGKEEIIAGSFYLKFNHDHPLLNLYSNCSKLNSTIFTYGDQGLFVKREVFRSIGGFSNIPIMEDLEIQKWLRSRGKFAKLTIPVVTSARRYLQNGIFMNQVKNIALVLLYFLGVSPEKLAKRY